MIENKYTNADGTSSYRVEIGSTVSRLKEVLGEPYSEQNDGRDKVNFEWLLTLNGTDPITVYDWKQYREIDEDEFIDFHIGGKSLASTEQAKEEILKLFTK
jgi:hypothetical protein